MAAAYECAGCECAGCETPHRTAVELLTDLRQRQLLPQPIALPFVARRVDALREQEGLVQAIDLLLDDLDADAGDREADS